MFESLVAWSRSFPWRLRAALAAWKVPPSPLLGPHPLGDSPYYSRSLLEALSVGIFTLNPDGRVVLFNDAAAIIWGRRPLAGSIPWWQEDWIFWPDGRRVLFEERPSFQVLQTGTPVRDLEMMVRRPNGSQANILLSATPVFTEGKEMTGVVITMVDITEKVLAKQSLDQVNRVLMTLNQGNEALIRAADEEELFATMCRVIVETGGYRMAWVGLVEHDPGKTIRPVAFSGAESGYLAQTALTWDANSPRGRGPSGRSVRTGLPEINNNTRANMIMAPWSAAALERGFLSSISLPLKNSDGVFGCLTIYASEINAFGGEETTLFIDLANDISYGVSAMRERQRREAMERHLGEVQKLEALGQLAGGVAHDFNNLLGAMLGFASFIADDTSPENQAHYYAQRIIAAGQRGKALVAQILSFARQSDIKHEPLHLRGLLSDISALLSASIPATTQVRIDLAEAESETEIVVDGDGDRLSQLLLNLCLNAHDALEGQVGTITMGLHPTCLDETTAAHFARRRPIEPSSPSSSCPSPVPPPTLDLWSDEQGTAHAIAGFFEPNLDHVSLVVSDNGCGMDLQLLGRIFSPFFTTKDKGAGTGLGLAVVHGVVLAHGGAMVVTSRIGGGTSFEIILPRAVMGEELATAARPLPVIRAAAEGRILLVDDDTDFGDMLLTGLERRGFEVSPTHDPLEALSGLKDYPDSWDAMVADQTMPGMTGLELIKAVREIQPTLPCILCTGYSEDQLDEGLLQEAGAFALMRKPVDLEDLVAKLQSVIPPGNAATD